MRTEIVRRNNQSCLVIHSDEVLITDAATALDLIMSLSYETGCSRFVLPKSALCPEFFVLSTGLAGEILQKFSNYRKSLAIVGDFSGYTSKPLKDFITESNRGNLVFFVTTTEQAIERLT